MDVEPSPWLAVHRAWSQLAARSRVKRAAGVSVAEVRAPRGRSRSAIPPASHPAAGQWQHDRDRSERPHPRPHPDSPPAGAHGRPGGPSTRRDISLIRTPNSPAPSPPGAEQSCSPRSDRSRPLSPQSRRWDRSLAGSPTQRRTASSSGSEPGVTPATQPSGRARTRRRRSAHHRRRSAPSPVPPGPPRAARRRAGPDRQGVEQHAKSPVQQARRAGPALAGDQLPMPQPPPQQGMVAASDLIPDVEAADEPGQWYRFT